MTCQDCGASVRNGDRCADCLTPTPKLRAKSASAMLETSYPDENGDSNECSLIDALSDLRHYADANGYDFHRALSTSYNHYLEERVGS